MSPSVVSSALRRPARWVLAVVVAVCVVASSCTTTETPSDADPIGVVPETYSIKSWDDALGGDQGVTPERLTALADLTGSDLGPDAAGAAAMARAVTIADLTGVGRGTWPGYWPDGNPEAAGTRHCTNVTVPAASPTKLPVAADGTWAKVLVAWTGTCPFPPVGEPHITYVYGQLVDGTWQPVRPSLIPGAAVAAAAASIPDSVVGPVTCAGRDTGLRARLEVTYAFDKLCADAAAAGVTVTATDGLRSAAEQAKLFNDAVREWGTASEAAQHVAPSDGSTCASSHCAGVAIDVKPTKAALGWLSAIVACTDGRQLANATAGACPQGTAPVKRAVLYGFTQPVDTNTGHLAYGGRLADAGTCRPSSGLPPADVIDATWRCVLTSAGLTPAQMDATVADAVAVARCSSGLDPAFVADQGRFRTSPSPADGRTHDESGLFALSSSAAAIWVPGGPTAVGDAAANAEGAARMWLAGRQAGRWGWERFECATGSGTVAAVLTEPRA